MVRYGTQFESWTHRTGWWAVCGRKRSQGWFQVWMPGKNGVTSFQKWAKMWNGSFRQGSQELERLSCMLWEVAGPWSLSVKGQQLSQSLGQPTATLTHCQIPLMVAVLPMVETHCNQWSGCQHLDVTVFGWCQKQQKSSIKSRIRTDNFCRDGDPFLFGEWAVSLGGYGIEVELGSNL